MAALTPAPAVAVTAEQRALIVRTIAQGASAAELELFFFDCARRGVHPLDKLIHFTKRSGRYTPVTSIDYMRSRAASTGEYAGQDDVAFVDTAPSPGFCATVTVYRLVQGTRYPFTATARWSEYKPTEQDWMWRKMPHTMLGKCAEALALRKGFPQELAGLYEAAELEQAGAVDRATGEVLEAPAPSTPAPPASTSTLPVGPPTLPAEPSTLPADPRVKLISEAQRRRLFKIAGDQGWTHGLMKPALLERFGLDSTDAIPRDAYDGIVTFFRTPPPRDAEAPF